MFDLLLYYFLILFNFNKQIEASENAKKASLKAKELSKFIEKSYCNGNNDIGTYYGELLLMENANSNIEMNFLFFHF